MGLTKDQQTQIRIDFQAGYEAGAQRLAAVTNENDRIFLESEVAELYSTAEPEMEPYFQGMWHKIGSVPLSFYIDYKTHRLIRDASSRTLTGGYEAGVVMGRILNQGLPQLEACEREEIEAAVTHLFDLSDSDRNKVWRQFALGAWEATYV